MHHGNDGFSRLLSSNSGNFMLPLGIIPLSFQFGHLPNDYNVLVAAALENLSLKLRSASSLFKLQNARLVPALK